MTTLLISFCCNDASGAATGEVKRIDCYEAGDLNFEIEATETVTFGWEKDGHGRTLNCAWIDGTGYRTGAVTHWAGNVFWDAARMTAAEVAALLNRLRRDPNWSLQAGDEQLFDAWDETADMTVADVALWCGGEA